LRNLLHPSLGWKNKIMPKFCRERQHVLSPYW